MGLFHHKDKAEAGDSSPQHCVIYLLDPNKEGKLREEFDRAFGTKPQVSLSFSRPPADVANRLAAGHAKDRYLTITPRGSWTEADKQRAIDAVHKAAHAESVKAAMAPVR